jgi:hypothetical protein
VSTASQSRGLRRTRPRYSSSHWPTHHAHNPNTRQQATPPNQAHHHANLAHLNAKQKLTTGKRVRRQAHLEVKASQSRPSVGIRIPMASLPIARHTRHQASRRTQARQESQYKSNGTNKRRRPRSQTLHNELYSKASGNCPAFAMAHTRPPHRRMHQVKEDQKTSSGPKLRPVELDCGKTHHLQRRDSQRGHHATRHISRSQRHLSALNAPAARLHSWPRAGDITCHPARMGSEGRQQEALITYSQRPVLCILFCHPRPSSQTRVHRSAPLPRASVSAIAFSGKPPARRTRESSPRPKHLPELR